MVSCVHVRTVTASSSLHTTDVFTWLMTSSFTLSFCLTVSDRKHFILIYSCWRQTLSEFNVSAESVLHTHRASRTVTWEGQTYLCCFHFSHPAASEEAGGRCCTPSGNREEEEEMMSGGVEEGITSIRLILHVIIQKYDGRHQRSSVGPSTWAALQPAVSSTWWQWTHHSTTKHDDSEHITVQQKYKSKLQFLWTHNVYICQMISKSVFILNCLFQLQSQKGVCQRYSLIQALVIIVLFRRPKLSI